jgi:hypothetical protein
VRRKYGKKMAWWTMAQLVEAISGQRVLALSNEGTK